MPRIQYVEGTKRVDTVAFKGTEDEAAKAAIAGLKSWETASQARILDDAGKLVAIVIPE